MDRHFVHELDALKEQLLLMGGRAESIVRKSITALDCRDPDLAREVLADDRIMDRAEIDIEERCLGLLALQQPLAGDLRFITSALKISNDLERVGDHAVNIAGSALRLMELARPRSTPDLQRLAAEATGMLHDALDAFVRRDAETARGLVRRDDAADALARAVFRDVVACMVEEPSSIAASVELLLVSRNLERVADLATNVAEEVVFIAEARIIKHHVDEDVTGEDFGRS